MTDMPTPKGISISTNICILIAGWTDYSSKFYVTLPIDINIAKVINHVVLATYLRKFLSHVKTPLVQKGTKLKSCLEVNA